ncbi:MAG: TraM recognition domain-containing protein, partial [Pseudomonadota bacterium]|nr:TraM recognition domain-containing protein [Pseudomonadota bacterium]
KPKTMAIQSKYEVDTPALWQDARPLSIRLFETISTPQFSSAILIGMAIVMLATSEFAALWDVFLIIGLFYAWLVLCKQYNMPVRLPMAGKSKEKGKKPAEGILFIGNEKWSSKEVWLTNNDARTHILFLGTTGSGKTEGLKSLVTNALTWGSGFIYVDGKADTDLWASLYSLARRFGRDDDLLLLNYMTGNTDEGAPSNSLNPFSAGSASYLTNLMVGLMDEAGGDNAMWKGRAIALMTAIMPALTWKRDHEGLLLDVGAVRDHLGLNKIVALSRQAQIPRRILDAIKGYLESLPGYLDEAFDDDGNEKPASPDDPQVDLSTCRQQHGYLSMQFTRALGSLSDEYGYIFHTQLADIDMHDLVLNRRILIVLIPALEKSGDEAANLGKIIVAALKGMMGATLGATVEGDWQAIIENKPTRAPSPFITVFDEVGYYTAQGMAVMAAQARSLGFSLIFAAQDLPALEKRVKEEARSIAANCNLKIFGKLEDPGDTKDFFEKTVGTTEVAEFTNYTTDFTKILRSFHHRPEIQVRDRKKAPYSELRKQKPGEVHISWKNKVYGTTLFYCTPPESKALRIQKLLQVKPPIMSASMRDKAVDVILAHFRNPDWTAVAAAAEPPHDDTLAALAFGLEAGARGEMPPIETGAMAIAALAETLGGAPEEDESDLVGLDDMLGDDLSPFPPIGDWASLTADAPGQLPSWARINGDDDDDDDDDDDLLDVALGDAWFNAQFGQGEDTPTFTPPSLPGASFPPPTTHGDTPYTIPPEFISAMARNLPGQPGVPMVVEAILRAAADLIAGGLCAPPNQENPFCEEEESPESFIVPWDLEDEEDE